MDRTPTGSEGNPTPWLADHRPLDVPSRLLEKGETIGKRWIIKAQIIDENKRG